MQLPGHILTRILSKTAHALCTLHRHRPALHLLTQLLTQFVFRRGRRGRWHEHRLLILMQHAPKTQQTLERAWACVCDALQDEDTHLIWRPKLERRREKLRKDLVKLGSRLCDGEAQTGAVLGKAREARIEGERIYHEEYNVTAVATPALNKRRKVEHLDSKQMTLESFSARTPVVRNSETPSEAKVRPPLVHHMSKYIDFACQASKSQTGKSIWRGRDGEEVTVEIFALQHYESQGYKGYVHLPLLPRKIKPHNKRALQSPL